MLILDTGYVKIGIDTRDQDKLSEFLNKSFSRRYLPDYNITILDNYEGKLDVLIKWILENTGFTISGFYLNSNPEIFIIRSGIPQAYINESPVFFLLQVVSRAYVRKNYIVFTDTVALYLNGKTVLLMGYPHTGKSTLSVLAYAHGYIPLSTENTVAEIREDGIHVVSGTPILVYDPRVEHIFNIKVDFDEKTKHGYHIIDLDKHLPKRKEILKKKPLINKIYVLHCSYNAGNPDLDLVKGRKIKKILWYFATALLKGIDYYEPYPLDLIDEKTASILKEKIDFMNRIYNGKIYEIYGRHDKVYKLILETLGTGGGSSYISTCS